MGSIPTPRDQPRDATHLHGVPPGLPSGIPASGGCWGGGRSRGSDTFREVIARARGHEPKPTQPGSQHGSRNDEFTCPRRLQVLCPDRTVEPLRVTPSERNRIRGSSVRASTASSLSVGSPRGSVRSGGPPAGFRAGPGGRSGMTCRTSSVSAPTMTRSMTNCKTLCRSSTDAPSSRLRSRAQNAVRSWYTRPAASRSARSRACCSRPAISARRRPAICSRRALSSARSRASA
jgi:hypothetical protein